VIIELFDAATFGDPELLRSANRDAVQMCFIVDDVERERQRLVQSGAECDPVATRDWGRCASFRDPEGNLLQVFEVFDRTT
jgi:predicted enzyme related to lactoylglutathione lyase